MLEQYLVTLFVKLAVAASLASMLARSPIVQRMLLEEERTVYQRLRMALAFSLVFGAGVGTRVLTRNSYQAVDLGLEGSLLCGILGGYVTGLVSGILISIPAMINHEWLTMPFFAGIGVVGGLLRDLAPDKEEIWRFSPFVDLSIYRLIRQRTDYHALIFQLGFFFSILFCEFLRLNLSGERYLHVLHPTWPEPHLVALLATYVTTLFTVTLPIKVWNNTRNERKLEVQQALLTEARLQALTRQINPHFLFNTLNSVASLIRSNPDKARTMVHQLSKILRRLLRKQENLCPLREELAFIDDYLSIEMVRFGAKLRLERNVDARAMDRLVPSMILQPLVENSIKHGLSSKVEGGTVSLHVWLEGDRLQMRLEDDGVGIDEEKLHHLFTQGIGMSNVNERLKVLYGNDFRLSVLSEPGKGTRIEIDLPALSPALVAVS